MAYIANASLEDWTDEYREFQQEGFERIKDYYDVGELELDDLQPLDKPPHEILRERAEKLLTMRESLDTPEVMDDADTNLSDILLGSGTEVLLKAITLQHDPDWFVRASNQDVHPPQTPPFGTCRDYLVNSVLPDETDLEDFQISRLGNVLELIQERRNNAVHFNFHHKSTYQTPHQVYQVIEYLLDYFFENASTELLEALEEQKEETEVERGLDFPQIVFNE